MTTIRPIVRDPSTQDSMIIWPTVASVRSHGQTNIFYYAYELNRNLRVGIFYK